MYIIPRNDHQSRPASTILYRFSCVSCGAHFIVDPMDPDEQRCPSCTNSTVLVTSVHMPNAQQGDTKRQSVLVYTSGELFRGLDNVSVERIGPEGETKTIYPAPPRLGVQEEKKPVLRRSAYDVGYLDLPVIFSRTPSNYGYGPEIKAKHPLVYTGEVAVTSSIVDLAHTNGSLPWTPWASDACAMGPWTKLMLNKEGKVATALSNMESDSTMLELKDYHYGNEEQEVIHEDDYDSPWLEPEEPAEDF